MSSNHVQTEIEGHVGIVTFDNPRKRNALTLNIAEQYSQALIRLQKAGARAIVVTGGSSPSFCGGIDLSALSSPELGVATKDHHPSSAPSRQGTTQNSSSSRSRGTETSNEENEEPNDGIWACEGRRRLRFLQMLHRLQEAMTEAERVPCAVIAAVHGACYGAGIDLITACDIRLSTNDARFSVKEVDMGITADMGTLARLPFIVGDGAARELGLTAREFDGREAQRIGLVSRCYETRRELLEKAMELAKLLAAKSPLALTGTKRILLRQRGRTVEEGLHEVSIWNAATLVGSRDLREVMEARKERRNPRFSKL